MNVFISHSWMDKTLADRLRQDLSEMAEVWFDIQQLKPGDSIKGEIDEALAKMDLVLVLWSKHSVGSDGVADEIKTARKLGKKLVPCLLDDTPLSDELSDIIGIEFGEYTRAYGRICMLLLATQAPELGMDIGEEMKTIEDLDGVLSYLNDYRNKKGISGDRGEWIERTYRALNKMTERVQKLKDRTQELFDYVQKVNDQLMAAGDDRARVEAILHDVIRNEHRNPEMLGLLRQSIENVLRDLPVDAAPEAGGQFATPDAGAAFSRDVSAAVKEGREQIREHLRSRVHPDQIEAVTDLVFYYISSAREDLDTLGILAGQASSYAGTVVVQQLGQYLADPNDLMPESQLGIWGFLDDAWIIHNTAYRLIEAGLVPIQSFGIDWQRIVAADQFVVACLPPMVLNQLQGHLIRFVAMIADEHAQYNPGYGGAGYGNQPGIGYGPAVGGGGAESDLVAESLDGMLADISLSNWDV